MRIYIAGASAELERAEAAISAVRLLGHEVAHDWPVVIRKVRLEGGRSDADLTQEERAGHAQDDLDAIDRADVFWLLGPAAPTSGAWVELGYALGTAAAGLTVVSGPHHRYLFCALADELYDYDEQALEFLATLAAGRVLP